MAVTIWESRPFYAEHLNFHVLRSSNTQFTYHVPACCAGIRATDRGEIKDGEGEQISGVCSEKQQERLCEV